MSFETLQPTSHYTEESIFVINSRQQCGIDLDLSLNDVGMYRADVGGAVANVDVYYPVSSGIAPCIDAIEIYDNDNLVETISDFSDMAAISNMSKNNGTALNIDSRVSRIRQSFIVQQGITNYNDSGVSYKLTTNASTTPTGSISLSNYSGFLSAMNTTTPKTLLLSKYHTLEIRIKWNPDPFKFIVKGTGVAYANRANLANVKLVPVRPTIVYKKYTDPATIRNLEQAYAKGIHLKFPVWDYEDAPITVATATGAVQVAEYRLKGITNKFVTKTLCQTRFNYDDYTANYNDGTKDLIGIQAWNLYAGTVGKQYSTPNLDEKMNIELNNSEFILDNVLNLPARKAYYRDLALGGKLMLLTNCDEKKADAGEAAYLSNAAIDVQKVQSYYAFLINKMITDYKVSYTKTQSDTLDFLGYMNADKGVSQTMRWRWQFLRYIMIKNNSMAVGDYDPMVHKF